MANNLEVNTLTPAGVQHVIQAHATCREKSCGEDVSALDHDSYLVIAEVFAWVVATFCVTPSVMP
jgi:hypothetical protein